MKHIGLYFGSFNPIHTGHLIIANHLVQTPTLDEVWFIVSPQNPFKKVGSLLNENHRYFLVQEAIEGAKNLKASKVEFQLPRPSYTIDTLTYLQEKYPSYQYHLIMGSDSFQNISRWKNSELVLTYPIIVYPRPGFEISLPPGGQVSMADAPLLEISSTRIREYIRQGKSIRYLVPDKVLEEIERNNYYRELKEPSQE